MKKIIVFITFFVLIFAGCSKSQNEEIAISDFDAALKSAKGKTVTFYGWGGDYAVNRWIDSVLAKALKEQYEINLKRVPMNIDEILNKLIDEKQSKSQGDMDIIWLNGENFFAAQKSGLLYGAITHLIPNFEKYIGSNNPDAQYDFGYPINGYEVPFGKAQLVFIGDLKKFKSFPKNAKEFFDAAKTHPGQITYPAPPDFVGSAFVRNIIFDIAGYENLYNAESSPEAIFKVIKPALDYLNEIKPYLWQKGKTYPKDNAALVKMFEDGQILFAMSYTPLFAGQKILSGEFPKTAQTFVFDKGNIGNTHYVAIPFNAPNKDAALVLINLIISPEMQISKYDIKNWGDLPVFEMSKLSKEQKTLLDSISGMQGVLTPEETLKKRIPEIQADKVAIIEKLWEEWVLRK